ncbi:mannose-6-phosphate isomerase, class I [Halalkalibacter urbisdiaboli]|uniref:mannose-6-phosphate isomerase, class I n=1 Tax=Halalkalibacter urbisdiaboli TaxID=1960589 RepID=UPI000B438AC3|nr:mannose-6-phosphate isomerase, class I [Halalkalibacter urbisdiaboli]
MVKEPLFLEPEFKERIWGGKKLKEQFNYDLPSSTTGECWGISAHPNGPSTVRNGSLKGKTLIELWENHRELFSNEKGEQFPLLVKILDANQDLSVQVHPDDRYAATYENGELGKNECWYVVDCDPDSKLVLGHNANTKEEFVSMIEAGKWDELFKSVPIKPGDFYYVPSGTVHAIRKGAVILETQQSSDTTYRVYDYDRTDDQGAKRELHIQQSIEVTTIPHVNVNVKQEVAQEGGLKITKLVSEHYFTVYHGALDGYVMKRTDGKYLLFSVLEGDGELVVEEKNYSLKKGDHFIIPSTVPQFEMTGTVQLIFSHTS